MTADEASRRKSLSRIGAVWDIGWTRERIDAYAEAIRPFEPALVEVACVTAIQTSRTRPAPADIYDACRELQRRHREWLRLVDQDREHGTHAAGPDPLKDVA